MTLKVLSWNIWHGKYLDKVIAFLKEQKPDIIALQEVIESETVENLAKQIANELGYGYVYCNAFETDRHTPSYKIGNAILSKYKIVSNVCHFLNDMVKYKKSSETEPKIAVQTSIDVDGTNLNVFNTHLAHSHMFKKSETQNMQVESLLKILTKEVTILLGDFNSLPESEIIRKLEARLINTDKKLTEKTWSIYPQNEGCSASGLQYRIDYIFTSPDIKVKSFKVEDSDGSDHLPISAVLEI